MNEKKEVKLLSGQSGLLVWEWPDGEERGSGLSINPKAVLTQCFLCPGCGEFVNVHAEGIRANERGHYYCKKCGNEIVDNYAKAQVGEGTVGAPIEIEVPAEYMTASILQYSGKNQSALSSWPKKRPLMGILGIPGSGKSNAIWAIAKNLATRGQRATIMIASEERRRWYQTKEDKRGKIEESWMRAIWLLIDDISAPPASDGWQAVMHDLLTVRKRHLRPTVVTTAAKGEELEEKYGAAIRSRLSSFEWLQLADKDWRKEKKPIEDDTPPDLFDQKQLPRALKIVKPIEPAQPNIGGGK